MHRLRLWIIIPLLALVGFCLALAAATGYLWDVPIQPTAFGSAANWAAAAVNIIVVSVTLHLADKGRRDAEEKAEKAKAAAGHDAQEILNTACALVIKMREAASTVPMGRLSSLANSKIVLKSISRLLEISSKRTDFTPAKVLRSLAMLEVTERALRYMALPFGDSDDDRNKLLDELVSDAKMIRNHEFDLRPTKSDPV
jgi:hypothetical protein